MHFFFGDMQAVSYEKDERINFVNFLGKDCTGKKFFVTEVEKNLIAASTGGLLGLFHGFSVLSAVEVLYFLTIRLLCSWRNHGAARKKVAMATKPQVEYFP
jgi:Amiloride-sensitive sodium channel